MSRIAASFVLACAIAAAAACEKVALLAPTGSTVTLSVSASAIGSTGSAEVVATVIESAGTPVHNGTEVTFQASVGKVDPQVVRTEGGIARTTFYANGASGTAIITAFSGGARSDEIELLVGSAAAEIVIVRTDPASVPATGGQVQVIATVLDVSGNPLSGAQVVFSSDNGTLGSSSAITDANGEARTTLTTNREANVTASVATVEGTARVSVISLPSASIQVSPATPSAGAPATITITPGSSTNGNPVQNVIVDFGDGTPQANLGSIASAQTVSHIFSRPGIYTITVTVVDTSGQRSSSSTVVSVTPSVVGVSITATPSPGMVGTPVSFMVSVANQNNVPITGITINYGDGTSTTHTGASVTVQKTYQSAGTFTVRATARDQTGSQYEGSTILIVQPRAAAQINLDAQPTENQDEFTCSPSYPKTCQASLDAFVPPPGVQQGIRVVFTASINGMASAVSYHWNFGDGTEETTSSASADRFYTRRGTYTITVRVTLTDGNVGEQRLTLVIS